MANDNVINTKHCLETATSQSQSGQLPGSNKKEDQHQKLQGKVVSIKSLSEKRKRDLIGQIIENTPSF